MSFNWNTKAKHKLIEYYVRGFMIGLKANIDLLDPPIGSSEITKAHDPDNYYEFLIPEIYAINDLYEGESDAN